MRHMETARFKYFLRTLQVGLQYILWACLFKICVKAKHRQWMPSTSVTVKKKKKKNRNIWDEAEKQYEKSIFGERDVVLSGCQLNSQCTHRQECWVRLCTHLYEVNWQSKDMALFPGPEFIKNISQVVNASVFYFFGVFARLWVNEVFKISS